MVNTHQEPFYDTDQPIQKLRIEIVNFDHIKWNG